MPKDSGNIHVETEAHKDGSREGIIANANGDQMGMRTDAGKKDANPFHVDSLKADANMQQFSHTLNDAFPKK